MESGGFSFEIAYFIAIGVTCAFILWKYKRKLNKMDCLLNRFLLHENPFHNAKLKSVDSKISIILLQYMTRLTKQIIVWWDTTFPNTRYYSKVPRIWMILANQSYVFWILTYVCSTIIPHFIETMPESMLLNC